MRIKTQRRIPHAMTKKPPLKTTSSSDFFFFDICDVHSIWEVSIGQSDWEERTGSGIEIRYASVNTLRTTVTRQSILEMAGWQESGRSATLFLNQDTYCRDRG